MNKYTVSRAINHWRYGVTSGDFIKRLLLSFIALYTLAYFLYTWLLGPLYVEYFSAYYLMMSDMQNMGATTELYKISGKMTLYGLFFSIFFVCIMAAAETAFHKNVFFDEDRGGFPIRFGAIELKVIVVQIVVYICWMIAIFIGYFGFFLVVMVLMLIAMAFGAIAEVLGLILGAILMIAAILAFFYFMAYILARLSPAAALTVHDDDIRFPEAWKLTKPIGKTMAISYLLVTFIGTLFISLLVGILGYILITSGEFVQTLSSAGNDVSQVAEAFREHLSTGKSKFLIACIILVFSIVYPIMWIVWAGIPNLAVKMYYNTDDTFS